MKIDRKAFKAIGIMRKLSLTHKKHKVKKKNLRRLAYTVRRMANVGRRRWYNMEHSYYIIIKDE